MNIGLYFGSFNPIHYGHLILAESILDESEMDMVWFVVSPQNPFKQNEQLQPEQERLHMVALAIEDNERMDVSDVEFSLPRPSYTINTLKHLKEIHPDHQFSLIMGADNLVYLHKWKDAQQILSDYKIYVYPRVGNPETPEELLSYTNIKQFDAPLLQISATSIRKCIAEDKSIRYQVPDKVHAYILANELYR